MTKTCGPDDETLQQCLACGGKFKIADHLCRYCTEGFMNAQQVAYWLAHKSGPRPKVDPTRG